MTLAPLVMLLVTGIRRASMGRNAYGLERVLRERTILALSKIEKEVNR